MAEGAEAGSESRRKRPEASFHVLLPEVAGIQHPAYIQDDKRNELKMYSKRNEEHTGRKLSAVREFTRRLKITLREAQATLIGEHERRPSCVTTQAVTLTAHDKIP